MHSLWIEDLVPTHKLQFTMHYAGDLPPELGDEINGVIIRCRNGAQPIGE